MEPPVRQDIIEILSTAIDILSAGGDSAQVRELSDHTIHNASTYQDEDSIAVAVLTYALAKLLARGVDIRRIPLLIRKARDALQRERMKVYKSNMRLALREIARKDAQFTSYIGEVITHAEIKKGEKLYEHGISLAKAAELLGVTQWDLMQYVGKQEMDIPFARTSLRSRIQFAKKLFGAP
ncbi:MAG TPA: hypothetical protein VJC16_04675 [Candidatus Nanoarchaeia archaeon]|nr:hypothetical protein [Candidatus Nanoarchaeia archaeon]